MRVSTRHHQHPLHLQVTRTNNGKFFVNPNPGQEHQLPHSHHHHHQQQFGNQQQPGGDEVAPVSPTNFPSCEPHSRYLDQNGPTIIGDRFLLAAPAEGSTLHRCVDVLTGEQLVAKPLNPADKNASALLQAHMRLEGQDAVSSITGVVDTGSKRYLLLKGHHGDLHAYVRARRRLREPEARRLFRQAVRSVITCHDNNVILRDLKLRKFVFVDEARTKLRLECMEDAVLVDSDNDRLLDRRGCPAYVAPEVLRSGRPYSGKAADIWSLGVLLYTMLVGRYPFNDAEHASLFAKISRGNYVMPDGLSPRARCLVRALLRREPSERPDAEDVLRHPWLARPARQVNAGHRAGGAGAGAAAAAASQDQTVPQMPSGPAAPTPATASSSAGPGPSGAPQQRQQRSMHD